MTSDLDQFFERQTLWKEEMKALRSIVNACHLEECFKWKQACYTFQQQNVLIISAFKNYCALNFFKGVLLADEAKLLIAPGENSQSGRQLRFTNLQEIITQETLIKNYIFEAIEVERAGLNVPLKKVEDYQKPQELIQYLEKNSTFKLAFEKLSPGRQKAYILHFSNAKQSQTKIDRIEKYQSRILQGKGIDDCVCGLSKRMPKCDGSHKHG